MSISGFTIEVRPQVALSCKVDGSIQEISFGLRDFSRKFDGVMTAVQMTDEGIQSQPAMLSNHENVVYVSLPYSRLVEIRVDESVFKEIHEVDCIVGGRLGAHGSAPYL